MQISLVDRVCGVLRGGIWIGSNSAPEVRKQAVSIIDRFAFGGVGAGKQYRSTTKERLNIMFNVSQGFPDNGRNLGFAAKPYERASDHPHLLKAARMILDRVKLRPKKSAVTPTDCAGVNPKTQTDATHDTTSPMVALHRLSKVSALISSPSKVPS